MIICLCQGISDVQIKKLMAQGDLTFEELQALCQVGSDCGECVPAVKKMLEGQAGLLAAKSCVSKGLRTISKCQGEPHGQRFGKKKRNHRTIK